MIKIIKVKKIDWNKNLKIKMLHIVDVWYYLLPVDLGIRIISQDLGLNRKVIKID